MFLVTPLQNNHAAIQTAVKNNFEPKDWYELQNNAGWLLRYSGTTVEVSNQLGITGQTEGERSSIGATLVTSFGAYYGRGPSEMWEWLKTRFERAP